MKNFLFLSVFVCTGIFTFISKAQNLSQVGRLQYPSSQLSSIWGYTDNTGKEYALVGTTKGFSIVDISVPTTPKQIHFVNGAQGVWREIKTFKHYAYVVHDNSNDKEGILIVDMENLQDTIIVKDFKGHTGTLRKAHTLYIDSLGYMYVFGGTFKGCIIYDLNNDPMNPEYVGITSDEYIHDGYVRGDTLWASNVFAGYLSVWNLADRTSPVKIAQFFTPNKFTHNAWLSDDSKTIFTTDERDAAPVAAYNIEDVTDAKLIDTWKRNANEQSIPHNLHVINDYLVISHYTEGVIIVDASDPRKMVKSGQFDTAPTFSGGGFKGCWGVYPYFKSGLIIASDIEQGLYILRPTYVRAGRLFGQVFDAQTLLPINNAFVRFADGIDSCTTNFDGEYKLGRLNGGLLNISFKADGYKNLSINRGFVNGITDTLNVYLERVSTSSANHDNEALADIFYYNDQIQVIWNGQSNARFTIFDTKGQQVISALPIQKGEQLIEWPTIPSGVYFAVITCEDGIFSKKVLKK